MRNGSKLALVLSGGGSRGAVEAGFYRALVELGIKIDLVVGSSVGAANGAFIAAGAPPEVLWRLWEDLAFKDLFSFNWRLVWRPKEENSLYRNDKFRRLLEKRLPVSNFEQLKIPLIIPGTELQSGETVLLESGSLIDAVLASTAIPGLFPPVLYNGRQIVDGSLVDNLPVDIAVLRGATTVLAMRCDCEKKIKGTVAGLTRILSRSLEIAFDARYQQDVSVFKRYASFIVLEPCLDGNIGFLDFSRSRELLDLGYRYALDRLQGYQKDVAEAKV